MNNDEDDTFTITSTPSNNDPYLNSTIIIGSPNHNSTVTTTGHTYTLGTSSINGTWAASPYSYDSITLGDYSITAGERSLDVKGDANFDGDVKIKGKSLSDVLDNIEKRLAILHPNPELEEKWERLKSLGQMYRELEQEILEKEKIWDIIKK